MDQDNSTFNLLGILGLIWKKRKPLLLITTLAGIIAAGLSLLMPNYYNSYVTLFPAKYNQININNSGTTRSNLRDFGDTEDAEQLLELAESDQLKMRIIDQFDLYNHYDVESDDPLRRTKVLKNYNGNVSSKRTKYNAIKIVVKDKDPKIASGVANAIGDEINKLKNDLITNRLNQAIAATDKQIDHERQEIERYKDSLAYYQNMGVVSQSERTAIRESLTKAPLDLRRKLEKKLAVNEKYGEFFDLVESTVVTHMNKYQSSILYRDQLQTDVNTKINHSFIVDSAVPAEKKSSPKRSILVLGAMISTFFFALICYLLLAIWPKYKGYFQDNA